MKVIREDGLFFQVAWAINTLNSIHLQMIKILSYTKGKEEGGGGGVVLGGVGEEKRGNNKY